MFRQHGCSKVKMWTRTMQGACQNLREWTPILRVERGEPLVWDMSVVRFVNLPRLGSMEGMGIGDTTLETLGGAISHVASLRTRTWTLTRRNIPRTAQIPCVARL
jgi:hypothetical protein